jgi:biopolymer transport protein TolQ
LNADLSILHLILGASPLVQLVMLLLFLASLMSWFVIFSKYKLLRDAQNSAEAFEQHFWSGADLGQLYKELAAAEPGTTTGMENLFVAGFREFARLHNKPGGQSGTILESAQRAMRVSLARQQDKLEHHLPFLATVGSTSPYIGLFGTVWGIMNSFRALGNVQQATISMVAPGISEALIATAMGLFAAIPAVIAYNRFAANTERLINRYDTFMEEFSAILQRQPQTGA